MDWSLRIKPKPRPVLFVSDGEIVCFRFLLLEFCCFQVTKIWMVVKGLANVFEKFVWPVNRGSESHNATLCWNLEDLQRRFLTQHIISTLLRHCFERLQHCSNIATLCCGKNHRCESSRVTSALSGWWSESRNNCRKECEINPLLSGRGHLFAVPTRVHLLLSPLLSGQ